MSGHNRIDMKLSIQQMQTVDDYRGNIPRATYLRSILFEGHQLRYTAPEDTLDDYISIGMEEKE